MAQVNKISSFKSFTEVKNQEATMKLRETNNAKRQETVGKIGAILDEMGLTSLSELDEEKKQALINKMFGNVSEDEAEDIEDEINKLGEPKKLEEGNAFIYAASKAKQEGKSDFEFNGKTYKVTIKKDTGLSEKNEGNEFGAAVKKAKDEDEDEFEVDGKTYKVEEATRTKFTGKTADDLYNQIDGKKVTVFVGNDWYWVNPAELKDDKGDSFTGYTKDGSDHDFYIKDIKFIQESVVNEARSISKIQYDWSKLTTSMQATAQNWKAAEGSAKEMLLGKLKEMTAQKKALEAELDVAIADKDKDLELVVSEAFYRLPKDVIGTELYVANQSMQSLYSGAAAGNDISPKEIDFIIKNLQQVKSLAKKFNKADEVIGTVYEGKAKDLKPNHKYTSDYGEVTFIKLNPDGKTMKLHSKETGEIKTSISNAYNMELIESVVNEGDMTKDYDGFIVLDSKTKKTYKFKYVKGTNNVKVENGAIDKLSNSTGSPKSNFMVHGFVGKGEWNSNDSEVLESIVNEAKDVKSEVIDKLSQFFGVSTGGLIKFKFDGTDNIKDLTKALNGTNYEGVDNIVRVAIKAAKKELGIDEATINEAEKFKSTKDFLDFLEEIDGMPENRIKRIMSKDYIDTPGGFRDEADDYDNDIEDYMISNMGKSDFNKLKTWWENNVQEFTVVESGFHRSAPSAEATRRAEQLKKLRKLRDHNEEQDRIKKAQLKRAKAAGSAKESVVVEGKDDYMARSGSADINLKKGYKHLVEYELEDLYNKLGALSKEYKIKGITATFESVVTEAEVQSDDEFKEYAMTVLKKAFGDEFDEAKAGEVVDGILKKCGDDYGAAVGMLTASLGESATNEAFDANYWEDYHDKSPKITSASKVEGAVEDGVWDWNDNNENGKENEVTSAGEKKVMKLAKDFFKAKGYICADIIDAMIAQES